MTTVPSLRQEKLWYIEQTSCCSTVEELENVPVNRTRATYPSTRGEEIDMEEAFDAVNKIVAMQNNLPESAAALFDLTQGSIPSVSCSLMLSLDLCLTVSRVEAARAMFFTI